MNIFRFLPLLSLALLAGCATTSKRSQRDAFATPLPDRPGLPRLARVAPGLYRGAQPEGRGYEELQKLGVKTVVSFRDFVPTRYRAEDAGLDYVSIPIHAGILSIPPSDKQLDLFFDTVLDPAKQPVFIHCKFGRDRAGLMTALYRMEVDGWDNERAVEEMHEFGFRDFYHELLMFAKRYEPRGYARRR